MMAADDDADVFEITDFTTASDWERFIARFEEILHEWKLPNRPPVPPAKKDEYANGVWDEKKDDIEFAGFKFDVTYTYLKSNIQQRAPSDEKERPEEENDNDDDENDNRNATVFTDLMNMGNDFPSRAHCLCRWYGLQEFLVIAPTQQSECLETESRINILLSSVSIALSNTSCPVPAFVQVLQKWRKVYTGVSIVPGAKVEFEMSHLRSIPAQYMHLSGLLSIFKSKLNCTYLTLPAVNVAVRFTYILTDWIHNPWPQEPPDFGSVMEGEVGCGDFKTLPFGACVDPVSELHLSCTWPCLSEDMIVEDHVYSDLDPMQAPQWSVRIQMAESPQCLLGEYLRHFLELSSRPETTDELLGGLGLEEEGGERATGGDISHALQRLTEPNVPYSISSLSNAVTQASARIRLRPDEAPIPTELLNSVLLYLFPDARGTALSEEAQEAEAEKEEEDSEKAEILENLKKQVKSAPVDSLTYKLAVVLCVLSHEDRGLRCVAHLWQEFVLEMRYRWEHKHFIPGVETCQPNMGACLLHQKLQMLNCCIERKIKRESLGYGFGPDSAQNSPTGEGPEGRPGSPTEQPQSPRRRAQSSTISDEPDGAEGVAAWLNTPDNVGSSSEDEEFFECNDEGDEETENTDGDSKVESGNEKSDEKGADKMDDSMHRSSMSSEASFKEALTNRPEGRLAPFKDQKLSQTGEQLYIPITQEPSPMTEDMIEEHAEVLAKLGSTAEGSQLRARMQSACLLSDMESFKAANPGAVLEDFVKWYSPRDWVEEEVVGEGGVVEKKGTLSARMQIPGNMWVEVWQSARAVPARRQKRLFDDTKEAEKVLHFLASLKPGDVVRHLLPMLMHAGIARVVQDLDKELPTVKTMLEQVVRRVVKASRQPDPRCFEDAVRMLELSETVIARGRSLRAKFTSDLLDKPAAAEELQVFVRSLMQQPEVAVRGGPCGPAGAIIHKLFVAAQRAQHMVSDDESESDSGTPAHRSGTMESHRPSSTVPDFPKPFAREYILRAMVPRPAPYSRVLPQKMFCVLMEKDYRLAGAFCSDTTFQ